MDAHYTYIYVVSEHRPPGPDYVWNIDNNVLTLVPGRPQYIEFEEGSTIEYIYFSNAWFPLIGYTIINTVIRSITPRFKARVNGTLAVVRKSLTIS